MKTGIEKHVWKILCVLFLIGFVVVFVQNRSLKEQVQTLLEEQKLYATKESKAYIVERISKQMEEIAYQQKDISDQRREEAVRQMDIAEKMRVRAEEGENLARKEQQKAQQYSLYLEDAKNVAEDERERAVEQQRLAEIARNEADTLSRLSLARSLASTSLIQYQSGNYDISGLLAYRAWDLMTQYKGNVYHPILYDALSKNSESAVSKKIHKGGVSRLCPSSRKEEGFVSVSKYGEISRWHKVDDRLEEESLFENSKYSFRDAVLDAEGTLFALDYGGRMVVVPEGGSFQEIVLPEHAGWKRIGVFSAHTLLLVAKDVVCWIDTEKETVVKELPVAEPVATIGQRDGRWLIFGSRQGCWEVQDDATLKAVPLSVQEVVTAFDWSDELQTAAVGTESGNIYLLDHQYRVNEKLVGHRSKVTQLKFNDHDLYSSAYDCCVNVWNLKSPKKEALSLLQGDSWIHCFELSANHTIWMGDEAGMVHRILISPDDMAALVKGHLHRDFTEDEWIYYFGKDFPRVQLNTLEK